MIDRYKKWKSQKGDESETESENSDSEESKPGSDMDEPWIMTVKGLNSLNNHRKHHQPQATASAIVSVSKMDHSHHLHLNQNGSKENEHVSKSSLSPTKSSIQQTNPLCTVATNNVDSVVITGKQFLIPAPITPQSQSEVLDSLNNSGVVSMTTLDELTSVPLGRPQSMVGVTNMKNTNMHTNLAGVENQQQRNNTLHRQSMDGASVSLNNGNSTTGNSSTATGKSSRASSPCLTYIVYPLLAEMQRKYAFSSRNQVSHVDLADVRSSFEMAERSSPGISHIFLRELIHKLVPRLSEARILNLLDEVTRDKI